MMFLSQIKISFLNNICNCKHWSLSPVGGKNQVTQSSKEREAFSVDFWLLQVSASKTEVSKHALVVS